MCMLEKPILKCRLKVKADTIWFLTEQMIYNIFFALISSSSHSWGQFCDRRIGQGLTGCRWDRGRSHAWASSEMCRIRRNMHGARSVVNRLDNGRLSGRYGIGGRDCITGRRTCQHRDSHGTPSGLDSADASRFLLGHLVVAGVEIFLTFCQALLKEVGVATASGTTVWWPRCSLTVLCAQLLFLGPLDGQLIQLGHLLVIVNLNG